MLVIVLIVQIDALINIMTIKVLEVKLNFAWIRSKLQKQPLLNQDQIGILIMNNL